MSGSQEFTLLLPLCNYRTLQQLIITKLQSEVKSNIYTTGLPTHSESLYVTLQEAVADNHPSALMVVGLDKVQDIDAVLAATNLVREEFRMNFPFPIWIWINDKLQQKLIRQVPDLESWATSVPFHAEPEFLQIFLHQTTERLYDQVQNNNELTVQEESVYENFRLYRELETAITDLEAQEIQLEPKLKASIAFALGELSSSSTGVSTAARKHYEQSLKLWEELDNPIRKGVVMLQLGQWWQKRVLTERENEKKIFQKSRTFLQAAITSFQTEQHLALESKCIRPLGRVLHQLQQWDVLEQVARRGLSIAQEHLAALTPLNQPEIYAYYCLQQAQGYRFLADITLARSQVDIAKEQAKTALKMLTQLMPTLNTEAQEQPNNSLELIFAYERAAAHFSLARAFLALGQSELGLEQLEISKQVGGPQYDPLLSNVN